MMMGEIWTPRPRDADLAEKAIRRDIVEMFEMLTRLLDAHAHFLGWCHAHGRADTETGDPDAP